MSNVLSQNNEAHYLLIEDKTRSKKVVLSIDSSIDYYYGFNQFSLQHYTMYGMHIIYRLLFYGLICLRKLL